jgi:hypothetical protein
MRRESWPDPHGQRIFVGDFAWLNVVERDQRSTPPSSVERSSSTLQLITPRLCGSDQRPAGC